MRAGVRPGRTGLAAVLAVAVLELIGPVGCSSGTDTGTQDLNGGTPSTEAAFSPLTDPEQVPVIARRELGENITVRRIILYENGFSLEVRDPSKPDNLDTYRYDSDQNSWSSTPVSVSLSDIKDLPETTFTLGAVKWPAIPGLMRQAYDGLDLESEHITAVSYDRINGQKPRVYIGVNGLRGNGRLLANADGTHVEVSRN